MSRSLAEKAEQMYRRNSQQEVLRNSGSTAAPLPDTATIKPIVERMQFVVDKILASVPDQFRGDWRYTAMQTFMKESMKDMGRVNEETLIPMLDEFANALRFVAHGDMADVLEEEDNAGTV